MDRLDRDFSLQALEIALSSSRKPEIIHNDGAEGFPSEPSRGAAKRGHSAHLSVRGILDCRKLDMKMRAMDEALALRVGSTNLLKNLKV